jgi:hypothetical protein
MAELFIARVASRATSPAIARRQLLASGYYQDAVDIVAMSWSLGTG